MLCEFQERLKTRSIAPLVQTLLGNFRDCDSIPATEELIGKMLGRGHAYLLLEKRLGGGICFFLPDYISESSWEKRLHKTTPKYQEVMNHIKRTNISSLAQKYAGLRDKLVKQRIDFLMNQYYSPRLPQALSPEIVGPSVPGWDYTYGHYSMPPNFAYQNDGLWDDQSLPMPT